MRTFRATVAALVAAVLAVFMLAGLTTTSQAAAPDERKAQPSRVIDEESPVQVRALAARIKGNVTQPVTDPATGAVVYERYVGKVVKVQVKKCGKCGWKKYKKVKTNKYGTYKYQARVPMKGLWKYRVTVPRSGGYAKTVSKPQGVWLG